MGEVRSFVELINTLDVSLCKRGELKENKVRSHSVEALVDTGAILSMLPQDVVEHLGLDFVRKAIVTYADERKDELNVVGPVTFKIKDRTAILEVLVGPPLSEPLIGQIALESMDLIVDCPRQSLTVRPESPLLPLLKLK